MANIVATNLDDSFALDAGDRLYVPNGVILSPITGRAISSETSTDNELEVVVDGTVISFAANAIVLDHDVTNTGENTLIIGETGVVRTLNIPGNSAVYMLGSDSFFQNFGEVTGDWGAFFQEYDNGIVENHGILTGLNEIGVQLFRSENVTVVNSGLISGTTGIFVDDSTAQISNSGVIQSIAPDGVALSASAATEGVSAVNTGVISSLATSILGSVFDDAFTNAGSIVGDVALSTGADLLRNLEDGNVVGEVNGDAGNDTLRGGRDSDTLNGDADDDLLSGRGGDDSLSGGDQNDTVKGGGGDDTLSGGDNDDSVQGGAGDDSLNGNSKSDTLKGGGGDDEISGGGQGDTINGGKGDDTLKGGGGGDVFVFDRNAGNDEITDMANGTDKIDLTAFGLRNFNQLNSSGAVSSDEGGVLIDLDAIGGSGSIRLDGFAIADLNGGDFIF